jgi:nucleoid-associated protein Lsr2
LSFRRIDVMARTVSVVVTDDIDGSADAQTVTFGLDGVTYEIDLSEANRAKLSTAFAPFVAAGRRSTRGGRRRGVGRSGAERVDRAAVRAWARETGLAVSERGRISAEVMRQYEAAH